MSTTRPIAQRIADTRALLETQGSGWLATASPSGTPLVFAVAFLWTGTTAVIATRDGTPTARNLDATGKARLVLGTPQDVVMLDATVARTLPASGATGTIGTAFVDAMGWDPAVEGPDWRYVELRPTVIQSYRGYHELGGHVLAKDGVWKE